MKTCNSCKQELYMDSFYKQSKNADGLRSICKGCEKIRKKNNYCKVKEVERKRGYAKKRRKTDLNFKIQQSLRSRLWHAIKNCQKKGSAISDLGCSIQELKEHISNQFQPGMSWDNWSKNGWHLDHIIPLAKFDLSDKEQLKKACHYTNLQPLWAKDNLKKGDSIE